MKRFNFVASLVALASCAALPARAAAAAIPMVTAPVSVPTTAVATMTIREALKANGIRWEAALAKSLRHDQTEVSGFTLSHEWEEVNGPARIAAAEARAQEYRDYKARNAN